MPGDGPGSRARGVPERGARTGQMRRGPPHRRESRVQTRPLTAVTADADRRRSLSADGPGSRVIFFRDCPLVFGCLNPITMGLRIFTFRFRRKVHFALFFWLYFAIQHSRVSSSRFFFHIPFAARDSSLRIRFLRNYVLLFGGFRARAPHVTHPRPRGARSDAGPVGSPY
jgi:hypothetical protein